MASKSEVTAVCGAQAAEQEPQLSQSMSQQMSTCGADLVVRGAMQDRQQQGMLGHGWLRRRPRRFGWQVPLWREGWEGARGHPWRTHTARECC